MHIETVRFGKVEFEEQQVILFPEGMLGLSTLRRFLHIAASDTAPVEFLQSVEQTHFCFPLLNPFLVRPAYAVDLTETDRNGLELEPSGAILVYCVATLARDVMSSTINLMAPIVMNPARQLGRQVVLEQSGYAVRESLARRVA